MLSALGTSQLSRITTFKAKRAEIFKRYSAAFEESLTINTPTQRDNVNPMWHLYPIRVGAENRKEIFENLRKNGINVQVNYLPAHLHPVFAALGHAVGEFPVSEKFYSEEISLPMSAALSASDVTQVITTMYQVVSKCE